MYKSEDELPVAAYHSPLQGRPDIDRTTGRHTKQQADTASNTHPLHASPHNMMQVLRSCSANTMHSSCNPLERQTQHTTGVGRQRTVLGQAQAGCLAASTSNCYHLQARPTHPHQQLTEWWQMPHRSPKERGVLGVWHTPATHHACHRIEYIASQASHAMHTCICHGRVVLHVRL